MTTVNTVIKTKQLMKKEEKLIWILKRLSNRFAIYKYSKAILGYLKLFGILQAYSTHLLIDLKHTYKQLLNKWFPTILSLSPLLPKSK